ncbi:MAG: outer membrane receptor for ferrienterochelin and colicins [Bacteroidia bacterium]
MKRSILILFILGIIHFQARAQSRAINGRVLDQKTHEGIEAVFIQTADNQQTVITDSNGLFRIDLPTNALAITINLQATGYHNKTIALKYSAALAEILLETDISMLDEVVVGESKSEKLLSETTVSLDLIQPKIIEDKNPIIMSEIVNQLPSVHITDDQASIRAGSGWSYGAGSRVMLMVDGMPMMNGDAGNVLWTFISADNIKQLEVIKGASSVVYGSAALNGVINVETEWPSFQPRTSFTTFSGVYSKPDSAGLNWSDKARHVSGIRILDTRRHKKSDFVSSLELLNDDGYRFGDPENRMHAGIDWRYRSSDRTQFGVRAHLLSTETGSFLLWKSYDSGYSALNDQTTITLGTKMRIDPFWTHYAKNGMKHSFKGRYLFVDNQINNGNQENNQSNSAKTFMGTYQTEYKPMALLNLIFGGMGSATYSNSPLYGGTQDAINLAAYLQSEFSFGRFKASLGGRLEHYQLNDRKETKPVFRTGANYKVAKATFLRASYGQGYRFPTIAESFITTTVGLVSVFPNNNLLSETGTNAELGIKQGYIFGKVGRLQLKGFIDVAAYQMTYSQMMEFTFAQWSSDVSPENGYGLGFKAINTGNTTVSGIDVTTNFKVEQGKHHLVGMMGYTYSNPTSNNPNKILGTDSLGNPLSYRSTSSDSIGSVLKYRSKHLFKGDVSYRYGKIEVGVSARFNSYVENIDLTFVDQLFSFFVPGIADARKLNPNGTWLFDARVSYKISEEFRLSIIANNVTNRLYMVRPADLGAPRMVMVQLKYVVY